MKIFEPLLLAAGGVGMLASAWFFADSGISSGVFGGVAMLLFFGAYDNWRERG